MTRFLGVLAIVLGLVAIAGSYGLWSDYRGEFRRMSSELAEMKVSLQLLNQRAAAPASAAAAAAAPASDSQADQIADLKNRIAILENVWRNPPAGGVNGQGSVPLSDTANATGGGTPPGGGPTTDCIPLGTRFLLTPNDTYAVCQTKESLTLLTAGNGTALLQDLGTLAEGGIAKLGATNCRVSLLSVITDGGFAEVRVTC